LAEGERERKKSTEDRSRIVRGKNTRHDESRHEHKNNNNQRIEETNKYFGLVDNPLLVKLIQKPGLKRDHETR
jgi:hypothetical protein